ncbi:MAG: diaminopimelate epimerase [Thermoleophilia bacterium]|nr:diaminopimelate epimerase [Thermoleophilia bacterium]
MRFSKWHGIGNDFLILTEDDLNTARGGGSAYVGEWLGDRRPRIEDDAVIAVTDRNFGVGGDGILVLGPPTVEDADARMLIHNADGSMADMCGNGIRVAARFLVERGIVTPGVDGSFGIETAGGVMRPTILEDGRVRVDMGDLTTDGIHEIDLGSVDGDLAGYVLSGRVVSVGNPHFVVRREPEGHDLHRFGSAAEHHSHFPDRSNIEFYEVGDADAGIVRMRVWERGVGETLACGTGACAVAFTARADAGLGDTVTVRLPGGDLEIEFDGDRAYMTGAAHEAWSGELDFSAIVAGMPAGRLPSHT